MGGCGPGTVHAVLCSSAKSLGLSRGWCRRLAAPPGRAARDGRDGRAGVADDHGDHRRRPVRAAARRLPGAAAEGAWLGLDEAEAYLGAWRAYPGLPAPALLDWIRRSPGAPAQLSLSAARALAADCGLVAEPVRAAGQPFIAVRHPGLSGTVLACRPGEPTASAGPVTVPVPAVGAYLCLYQASADPRWVTALGGRGELVSQLTEMIPYLIAGTSLFSADARGHVDAAADAAGAGDGGTVKDLLRRAWAVVGPFAPTPTPGSRPGARRRRCAQVPTWHLDHHSHVLELAEDPLVAGYAVAIGNRRGSGFVPVSVKPGRLARDVALTRQDVGSR